VTRRSYAGGAAALVLTGGTLSSSGLTFSTTGTATGWPDGSGGKFFIVIDRGQIGEEKILVTSRASNAFTIASVGDRGKDGTSATSHLVNAAVEHCGTATDLDEANAHVNDITTDVHPQYTTAAELATGLSAYALTTAVATAITHWQGHTFVVAGEVFVPSGDVDFIVPLYVPVYAGRTVKLAKCRYKINAGTSVTAKLQINGSDATGFTAISVTTTVAETDPTNISLADGDRLALVVTAVSGNPKNMTFTCVLEHG
jgi:hypothetical protein